MLQSPSDALPTEIDVKPVMQSILPSPDNPLKGDCFRACLASVLEMRLEEVPHYMEHADWFHKTNRWIAQLGLALVEAELTDTPYLAPMPPGIPLIVSGRTRRHPTRLHCVVARTMHDPTQLLFQYIHDPHPEGSFLISPPEYVMWPVALNPELLARMA